MGFNSAFKGLKSYKVKTVLKYTIDMYSTTGWLVSKNISAKLGAWLNINGQWAIP